MLSGNSGANSDGIEIGNVGADNNKIYGNYIGTNHDGTAAIANARHGVVIYDGVQGTEVGGTGTGQGNIISGNTSRGVLIDGNGVATTTGNVIQGNLIGLNAAGNAKLSNGSSGIEIFADAAGNTIGGTTAAARNVISGNVDGIYIQGAPGTIIQGNYIGTDVTGLVDLGNSDRGIQLESGADNTIIGGVSAAARNVISGNDADGIIISDGASPGTGTTGTVIQGNYIGLGSDGTTDLGNGANGVRVTTESNHTIGGTAAGAGNTIAFNDVDGVNIQDSTAKGNSILGNVIHSNGGQGIDLGNDDVTSNDAAVNLDADSGANDLQNFPLLWTAEVSGSDIHLVGSIDSEASTQYRIEFFNNPLGTEDGTGHGEAREFLGFTVVTTDGSGNASIDTILSGVTIATADRITSTATKIVDAGQIGLDDGLAYGSTSEFSLNLPASPANSDPVLSLPGGPLTYTENDPATPIEPGALVSDVDGLDFDGGQLTVDVPVNGSGSDRIEILHEGMAANQVGVVGSNVYYSGVQIGTFTGSGAPMRVTFNAASDATSVQAVVQSVTFRNLSDTPSTADRTVRFVVTDGDGGTSATLTETIFVNATNDAPVVSALDGEALNYAEGDGAVVIEQGGDALVFDADSADFAGGMFTVEIDGGGVASEDVLSVRNQGTGADKSVSRAVT